MWLVKEIWFHRKQHYLNILANSVAIFLVLIVNVLSNTIVSNVSKQISSLGLDVTMLQVFDGSQLSEGWFDSWCQSRGIKTASVFYSVAYDDYNLVSCNAQLSEMFDFQFSDGQFFSVADDYYNDNVIVLGNKSHQKFGYPKVDQEVLIDGVSFKVAGIINSQDGNLFIDVDNTAFVPSKYHLRTRSRQISYYFVGKEEGLDKYLNDKNYVCVSQGQVSQATNTILSLVQKVLLFLAFVAVFVSFLGLINNTLSSLKERTFEIGVKKAFGASSRFIYLQFMLETMCVLLISTLISLLLMFLILFSLTKNSSFVIDYSNTFSILIRILLVGLICGLFPAYKASKVTVMAAIRNS